MLLKTVAICSSATCAKYIILVRAECVRALPLAAGRNEGGHYFRYFGPIMLRAPAEQTKVATVFGN